MNERTRVLLLLAVSLLVYVNASWNSLVFDDELYIQRNPEVTSPSVTGFFKATTFGNVFRPVTFASFALDWRIGGGRPFGFHVVNQLLHALVTVLLYLLLRKLLEGVPEAEKIAFAAALLFTVHPIHTEAVAWASARSELLAAGFVLAAWLLHLEDHAILALLSFVLALLSKESAVAFLPLALFGDWIRAKLKPAVRYVGIGVVAALYVQLLWIAQGRRFGEKSINFADNPLVYLPALWRILNALRILWKYVGLQLYPATLSCDYSYNAILLYMNWRRTVPAAVAAALLLGLWVWSCWKRKTEWALAGAIYFGGFAVTANLLLATGTIMAERLAYFPSAGFCLLMALIWIRLERRRRTFAWALLIVGVVTLGGRTLLRNWDWRNNFTLFASAVQAVPGSTKMHADLGIAYLYAGQLELARKELETALRIYPDLPQAVGFLGLVEAGQGQDEEARRTMEKAVSMVSETDVNYDILAVNLAAQLIKLRQDDEALKILNEVTAHSPGYARAWLNRAVIHRRRGEFASARTDAETALRLEPANAQARDLLKTLGGTAAIPGL